MSRKADLLGRCARCGDIFPFEPTLNCVDYCASCILRLGRRMSEENQRHMNLNWQFQRDVMDVRAVRTGRLIRSPFEEPDGTRPFVFMGRQFVPKEVA